MAIDLATERIISVRDGAKLVPPGRKGGPTHHSKLIRAIIAGQLDGYKFGRSWVTSVEALERWGAAQVRKAQPVPAPVRTPTQRRRAFEQAERDLDNRGVGVG
jgi:hypothetical protein